MVSKDELQHRLEKYGNRNYSDFCLLDEPMPFNRIFRDISASVVQVHDVSLVGQDPKFMVGFCGVFEWNNNEVVSSDGDTYDPGMKVLGYRWFAGESCGGLDILVEEW